MPVFTKKPVDVEMIQWTGDNYDDVVKFIAPLACTLQANVTDQRLSFFANKAQATFTIERHDWIAKERDESGFYPVSNHDHADSYEGPKRYKPHDDVLDWADRGRSLVLSPEDGAWMQSFVESRIRSPRPPRS